MQTNRFRKLFRSLTCIRVLNARYLHDVTTHEQLLVSSLGIKPEEAQSYITRYKLQKLDSSWLSNTLNFLKSSKYDPMEILNNPALFSRHRLWEQCHRYFQECGCSKVPLYYLLTFRKMINSSIKELKDEGVLRKNVVVPQELIKHLNPRDPYLDIEDLKDENLSLTYVHTKILHRYLMRRLGATEDDIQMLCRVHSYIHNKSLKYVCQNINFALDIGYNPQRLLRNGYILSTHPGHTTEVLESIPNFVGADMKHEMLKYPKLIGVPLQRIQNIYAILQKEKISDALIKTNMNIFTLNADTIRERLEDIKSTPETRVLMNNPYMLTLVVHYHRAKNRLSFLQSVKLKCTGLHLLGIDNTDYFDGHIKEGKDVNRSNELGKFIRNLVKSDDRNIQINIKKHPYHLYVPYIDIEDTYLFLKSKRFENNNIIPVIQILFYSRARINEVFEKMKLEEKIIRRKPRISKTRFLNIALYFLEKDFHFTGNGIWRTISNEELM